MENIADKEKNMKTQTTPQSIYKRFKQLIILGTVAILPITTATATAPDFETTSQTRGH